VFERRLLGGGEWGHATNSQEKQRAF
jgi:hypothetical protein